jgi:hypothetical protein
VCGSASAEAFAQFQTAPKVEVSDHRHGSNQSRPGSPFEVDLTRFRRHLNASGSKPGKVRLRCRERGRRIRRSSAARRSVALRWATSRSAGWRRCRRDVLRDPEEGARQPPQLAIAARAPIGRVRIHRGVRQPPAPALHPWTCARPPTTNSYDSRHWVVEINRSNNNNQHQHQVSPKPGQVHRSLRARSERWQRPSGGGDGTRTSVGCPCRGCESDRTSRGFLWPARLARPLERLTQARLTGNIPIKWGRETGLARLSQRSRLADR